MPIQFACSCGKRLAVKDGQAGKHAKCPVCGALTVVPTPLEPELVDEDDVDNAKHSEAKLPEYDIEVVEDDSAHEAVQAHKPSSVKLALSSPPPLPKRSRDDDGDRKTKKKGKRKSKSSSSGGDDIARMYLEEAERKLARDKAREQWVGRGGGGGFGGWTMCGVHITAGVLSGAGMLIVGLTGMIFIGIYGSEWRTGRLFMRLFVASMVFTALGAITFVKSAFFGEEPD